MTNEELEQFVIEQAVYKAIEADTATNKPGNLRSQVNDHYLTLYEMTGATGFEVRVRGQKVGTYGFSKVRAQPERRETRFEVADMDALIADDDGDFAEWLSAWVKAHLGELAVQYCTETGELLDGMATYEHLQPATPETIRRNGTLRVKPERVAEVMGNALPGAIAGLLGGGD